MQQSGGSIGYEYNALGKSCLGEKYRASPKDEPDVHASQIYMSGTIFFFFNLSVIV